MKRELAMIAQAQEIRTYSPEEYLELEIPSVDKHEYIDGEIRLMTGGMPNHNRIINNFSASLNFAFKGKSYEAFVSDQRLWISSKRIYTYPDIMIIQGDLQFQEGRKDTLTNPSAIIEVLSKSTQNYDKGDKFTAYRSIPSFQEYILVDQYSTHVEHYVKTEQRKWIFQEYDEGDTKLVFSSLPFEILLADIYDKVKLEPAEADIDI
jgi:Uma2 family endonuclease